MDYRTALRQCREQSGVKARELASFLGIDNSQLSRVEKGTSSLDVPRFFQACHFLKISGEKLFEMALSLPDDAIIDIDDLRLTKVDLDFIIVEDTAMMREEGKGKGIYPGAKVFYELGAEPQNQDLVVVRSKGRTYVRQYIDDMGTVKLKPFNEKDYETRDASAFEIIGVVRDVSLEDAIKNGL